MVDSEKRETLANARRQLKKFRDQHQPNTIETNGNSANILNGIPFDPTTNHNIIPPIIPDSIHQQQTLSDAIPQNFIHSPTAGFEEPNRQHVLPIENQNQQRSRTEGQKQSTRTTSSSARSSLNSIDADEKLRRDMKHLQEQLEVHVQTIGMLVAEKSDLSAKLTQSFKQLERKQSEMDELHGRLKASRERVQELEKEMSNSTSNIQKRELAAKEFDKENDRLKIENIRQSQAIEDLKQNVTELNEKLRSRQSLIDQLNHQLEESKQQPQKSNEISITEQQVNELKETIQFKSTQIEELTLSINRIRSDNEQFQQYNANMQNHIQELNIQIHQLTERNNFLQNENDSFKTAYGTQSIHQCSIVDHNNLQQENSLYRNAIDQWSNRYQELEFKLAEMTKLLNERDELIVQLKANNSNNSPTDQQPSVELQEQLHRTSYENVNLKQQIEYLTEHIQRIQSTTRNEQQTQTEDQSVNLSIPPVDLDNKSQSQQDIIIQLNEKLRENAELKTRIEQLDHVVLQLQSETETIGDYVQLYQQQREQLQKRYQEKDNYIQQLAQERLNLQKKVSELELLFVKILNISFTNQTQLEQSNSQVQLRQNITNSSISSGLHTEDNQESNAVNTAPTSLTSDQKLPLSSDKPSDSMLLELSDETKSRVFELIQSLTQSDTSLIYYDHSSKIKRAFVDSSIYSCSTCSGVVKLV